MLILTSWGAITQCCLLLTGCPAPDVYDNKPLGKYCIDLNYIIFSKLLCTPLDINDLFKVKLALIEAGMAAKWRDIGLALGLRNDRLDVICSNNRTSEECLTAMATEWLNRAYDMGEQGEPSLQRLSEAVGNPAGGNNPAEAEKILQNWTIDSHNKG